MADQWREGHPDVDGLCIVYAESADPKHPLIISAWYDPNFGYSLLPKVWCDAITHWMPLPEPPTRMAGK